MKTILIILSATVSAFGAETSKTNPVTYYTNRLVAFETLDHRFNFTNAVALKSDLDGLMIRSGTSLSMVNFTNIPLPAIIKLGLSTNSISVAAERASAKGTKDRNYQNSLLQQKQKADAEERQWREDASRKRPLEELQSKVQAQSERLNAQRELVKNLQRQNDHDWDRYMEAGTDDRIIIQNGVVDSADIRRSKYYASKRALRDAREALEDMEAGKR